MGLLLGRQEKGAGAGGAAFPGMARARLRPPVGRSRLYLRERARGDRPRGRGLCGPGKGRRPASRDPGLALLAARVLADHGRLDRAEALLGTARGRTRRSEWHRASAQVSHRRGNLGAALEAWSAVAAAEPESIDAHQAVANLLAATEGKGAALVYARSASARFPDRREFLAFRSGWERRSRARPSPPTAVVAAAKGAVPEAGNKSTALWASYLVFAFIRFVVCPLVEAWLR